MKKIYLLTFISVIALYGHAQTPIISPENNYTVCPREGIHYKVIPGDYTNCGDVTWTITKGSFSASTTVTTITESIANSILVYWNDVAEVGTLKATTSCSEGGTLTVGPISYAIRSLKGKTPLNLRIQNGSAPPLCGTDPLYIAVDRLSVPNTGFGTSIPQYDADGYEWELSQPGAWIYSGSNELITLTPKTGCSAGTIRVRAYIGSCSGLKYSEWTDVISLRTVSPLTMTANGASSYNLQCGSTNSVTFTTTSISCANNYTWSFPAGWRAGTASSPVTTTTNSIVLTPLPTPENELVIPGTVTATANLSCGTYASSLSIYYNDPALNTPAFTGASVRTLCSNTSGGVSVNPVPDVASYQWYVESDGLFTLNGQAHDINNPLITTSNSVTAAVSMVSSGFNTRLYVKANRPGGCKGSITTTRDIWAGEAQSLASVTFTGPPCIVKGSSSIYEFYANPYPYVVPGATSYQWQLTSSTNGILINAATNNIWATISAASYVPSNLYAVTFKASNACGEGDPVLLSFRVIGSRETCSGGGVVPTSIGTYPNPADNTLTVSFDEYSEPTGRTANTTIRNGEKHSIRLLNKHQELVLSQESDLTAIDLDTSLLPEGLYILKISGNGIDETKHVQITH